ncbi:hypothetical protein TWF696_000547 [Orbilia brochopaga]|uniref:Uncharacterized protein n=1 Tax=Orbilia brochopaga TaxID=3140254 RepID=A0AAV9VD60_9PEZI
MENEKQDLETGRGADNPSPRRDNSQTRQKPSRRLSGLVFIFFTIYAIWQYSIYRQNCAECQQQDEANPPEGSGYSNPPGHDFQWTIFIRSRGSGSVACYPRIRGTYFVNDVTLVELDFLGLDRFKTQYKSPDEDEEEAFCERLHLLGSTYLPDNYKAWDEYLKQRLYGAWTADRFCWPSSGGVWVKKFWLSYNETGAYEFYGGESGVRLAAAIRNADTMDERCRAFERAGAKFCARVEDCEETKRFIGKKIDLVGNGSKG